MSPGGGEILQKNGLGDRRGGQIFTSTKLVKGTSVARPRTPSKILDARGAFKKNPDRKRDGEPEVKDPIGAPPEDLTDGELKAWNMIVARAPMGVLTSADWPTVWMASRLWAGFITEPDYPAGKVARLHAILGQFGLDPSSRAKMSIEKPKDVNPFDSFS